MLTATCDYVFKRSDELSAQEREQFRALFERVFAKTLSQEQFERKFCWTPLGFSHHGLMVTEGQIVGAYNLIPYRYSCFGSQELFALSVDAMIDEEHRSGPFNMVKMAKLVYEGAARDGVVFAFGFPNDQAYVFTKRVLRWRDIGELEFYALPINIGAVRASLKWADPLSRLFSSGFVRLPRLSRPRKTDFAVEKVCDDLYRRHRYDDRHHTVALSRGGECTLRVCEEDDGIRALYIIDVTPLTADRLAEAVRHARDMAASRADLLLYVGWLPFSPQGLVRVPPSRCPRRIKMCGRILDPTRVDDRILKMANWNVNVSNFDVR